MIPTQTLESFPIFGSNATKVEPGDAKKAAGWQQADVVPAEWMNWEWYKASKGITDLNSGVSSIETEINNVLISRNETPDDTKTNQLLTVLNKIKAEAVLAAHPVGSLYWTSSTDNPATTFGGGTWVQIKDKFILAAGDTYSNGATGGAATVTLTIDNMPMHNHNMEHTHEYTPSGKISSNGSSSDDKTSTLDGSTYAEVGFRTINGTSLMQTYAGRASIGGVTGSGYATLPTEGTAGINKLSIDFAHQHSAYFIGSKGTTSTISKTNTENRGSGTAHENMPPYIVKYCWQRTA